MHDIILVPTDGSGHALRAAEHAATLSLTFDATIHVLNVVDVEAAAGPFSAGGIDREFRARLEAEREEAIDAARAATAEIETIESAIVDSRPAAEILDYAAEHDAILIAMGTVGRTGLGWILLGSTTERIVRRADVPVVAVGANQQSAD